MKKGHRNSAIMQEKNDRVENNKDFFSKKKIDDYPQHQKKSEHRQKKTKENQLNLIIIMIIMGR